MIRGFRRNMNPYNSRVLRANIHNRFDIEIVDAETGITKQRLCAENTVCNSLWKYVCGYEAWNNYIHYGGGEGTPSAADTSLFSFIGQAKSESYSSKYDPDTLVYSHTRKIAIDEATAVGANITEVGIGYGTSASTLLTHAMLKDMNGNRISIEKTDTDIINIYATVFLHLSLQKDLVFQGCTGGLPSTLLTHGVGSTTLDGLYCFPGVGYLAISPRDMGHYSSMTATHDVSNRKTTFSMKRMAVDACNMNKGIKSLFITRWFNGGGATELVAYVEEDSPWYSNTTITGEAVGTGDGETKDFATKFGFVKNLEVLVDGEAVEVTTDFGTGFNMATYLKMIQMPLCPFVGGNTTFFQAPLVTLKETAETVYCNSYRTSNALNLADRPDRWPVYENVLFETHGIKSITVGNYQYFAIECSHDLVNWSPIEVTSGEITVPEELQFARYWRLANTFYVSDTLGSYRFEISFEPTSPLSTANNIHFTEAPPIGSVITANYDAVCIGKDSDHVFDFSLIVQYGEYNEG